MANNSDRVELQVRERAFNRRIRTFAIVNKAHIDIDPFLDDAYPIYQSELSRLIEEYTFVKTLTIFTAEFEKIIDNVIESSEQVNVNRESAMNIDGDDNEVSEASTSDNTSARSNKTTLKQTLYLTTSNRVIGLETDLSNHFESNIRPEIIRNVDDVAFRGSGFTLSRIIELGVQVCSYQPLDGSSYIKTPSKLDVKRAIVNVVNKNDEMCFKWAVLSALHPQEANPNRISHYYRYNDQLNFRGIHFPVRIDQIDKFLHQNDTLLISINVYYYDEEKKRICPLKLSSDIKENHIHLLLLFENRDIQVDSNRTTSDAINTLLNNGAMRTHYCWIKDLSRLVSSQLSNHHGRKYICDRCLNFFDTSEKLSQHIVKCVNECSIEMPTEKNKWVNFQNYENKLRAPFVIYADTESYLKPINPEEKKRLFSEGCNTVAEKQHCVYNVGYYFECGIDRSKSYYASSGNRVDCIEWFIKELEIITKYAARMLLDSKAMDILNSEQLRLMQDANVVCHICEKPFEANQRRVADHCHFTGKFRGPAHGSCNLKFKDTRIIPVIMHNLSRYDAHLFIKQLAVAMGGKITIIPQNAEEYISFTKIVNGSIPAFLNHRERIQLKFLDSFRFMAQSLSDLASWIPENGKSLLYAEYGKMYSKKQITMLERKGVFPYDYIDSLERLNETSLPPKAKFKNDLTGQDIEDKDYEFACNVWNQFGIKTLGEYSELYMKTDVLLLAVVFENFRNTCHRIYKLDPAHYYTSPGLSFDAMLKYTGVNIELMTDIEMLLFAERGIRGGMTQCSIRHIKANNKYMKGEKDKYDPDKKSIYLMDYDG